MQFFTVLQSGNERCHIDWFSILTEILHCGKNALMNIQEKVFFYQSLIKYNANDAWIDKHGAKNGLFRFITVGHNSVHALSPMLINARGSHQ